MLLLGDSIAAGLGAERRRHSLGVQVAKRVSRHTERAVRVISVARVGAESRDLPAQLADLPTSSPGDVAIIVVGGNDVIHRRPTTESTGHLDAAVRALRRTGCQVVVGTCPDLGALTAVPQPLRGLGRQASRRLADAQREMGRRGGAYTVTLSDVVGPHFLTRPDEMFALDRFHPSAAGYRRIAKALMPSVLAALGSPEPLSPGHHAPH